MGPGAAQQTFFATGACSLRFHFLAFFKALFRFFACFETLFFDFVSRRLRFRFFVFEREDGRIDGRHFDDGRRSGLRREQQDEQRKQDQGARSRCHGLQASAGRRRFFSESRGFRRLAAGIP